MLVTVTDFETEPPSVTVPKLKFVGLIDNVWVAEIPVPDTAIIDGDEGALLITDTAPLVAPVAVGRN